MAYLVGGGYEGQIIGYKLSGELLKPAEEGVQAKGKELGAKWAALTNTAPRGNDGGEGVIHAEEKVSGR